MRENIGGLIMDAAAFGGAGDLTGQIDGVAMNDGFAHAWSGADAGNAHNTLLRLPDGETSQCGLSRSLIGPWSGCFTG